LEKMKEVEKGNVKRRQKCIPVCVCVCVNECDNCRRRKRNGVGISAVSDQSHFKFPQPGERAT
jgi:hypothetical protein